MRMASRVRLAQVQLKSWVHVILEDVGRDIKRSAGQMGIQTSGVIRLPTKTTRWSVLRSPFVNKSAMDQVRGRPCRRNVCRARATTPSALLLAAPFSDPLARTRPGSLSGKSTGA